MPAELETGGSSSSPYTSRSSRKGAAWRRDLENGCTAGGGPGLKGAWLAGCFWPRGKLSSLRRARASFALLGKGERLGVEEEEGEEVGGSLIGVENYPGVKSNAFLGSRNCQPVMKGLIKIRFVSVSMFVANF